MHPCQAVVLSDLFSVAFHLTWKHAYGCLFTDVSICTDLLVFSDLNMTYFYQPSFSLPIFRISQMNTLKIFIIFDFVNDFFRNNEGYRYSFLLPRVAMILSLIFKVVNPTKLDIWFNICINRRSVHSVTMEKHMRLSP